MSNSLKFKRVLLKLSGQSLGSGQGAGFSPENIKTICEKIKSAKETGVEIGIVLGGGNFVRGKDATDLKLHRSSADKIGMLGTIMNSICLSATLNSMGIESIVMNSTEMSSICETFTSEKARRELSNGKIVIFSGGTGNPYFTTDTAATLKALETNADILLKATRVNGVYSADPEKDKNAIKYDTLSIDEVIDKNLKIMDMTAFTLMQENNLPLIVFDIGEDDILKKVICGEATGTIIK